jgi:hypothetical protein
VNGTYLEEKRVLDQSLHGLQEETIKRVEIGSNRVVRELNLFKDLVCDLRSFSLVGNKGLVNVECAFIKTKRRAPALRVLGHGIGRLDANKKSTLKVQNGINVEEYLVENVAGDSAFLLESLFEVVEILQILYVFAFGIDKFLDNVISVAHLQASAGRLEFILRVWLQLQELAMLLGQIENIVDNLSDL